MRRGELAKRKGSGNQKARKIKDARRLKSNRQPASSDSTSYRGGRYWFDVSQAVQTA